MITRRGPPPVRAHTSRSAIGIVIYTAFLQRTWLEILLLLVVQEVH